MKGSGVALKVGHIKKVRPPNLAARCPWSRWHGQRGCFGSPCSRNLLEMPIWVPEAESQWVEATGCPLGYCQILWLLGTVPGRQSSYHDNHSPPHVCDFGYFSFPIKCQPIPGFQRQANIALRTECPLLQEVGEGRKVEMCICYD